MLRDNQIIQQQFNPKGGLNTFGDPLSLAENESPDSLDAFFNEDGSVGKRYGAELLNKVTTGYASQCNGLFDYGVSPGVRKLMGVFGTTLYKMDDLDGTFDSLDTNRSDTTCYFERSGTRLIICDEVRSTVKYWDGSAGSITTLNSSAPLARLPKSFQGYLFLANTSDNPRRLYYQDESTITTGTWANYFTFPSSSDDEVIMLVEYNGRLYASLRSEWYRVSFVGGSAIFDYKKVSSVIGGIPKTIQVVSLPNVGEVIMYLGWNKKVYIFDGTSSYSISAKYENNNGICPVYLNAINQGGLGNSHAVVETDKALYKLYVPIGSTSTISHCFNISLNSLSCSVTANQEYSASCMAEDSNKKRWHIVGGYDGVGYKTDRLAYDEVCMNNVPIGTDAATVSSATYVRDAGGFTGGTHNAASNVTYAEDSSKNFTTLGVLVGDYVVNKTDTFRHVITAVNNGGGTNAQLDYANTEDDTDSGDVFQVYKAAFIADNDSIYIGSSRKFNVVMVDLIQSASATIVPLFYYSSPTGGTYTAMNVTDNTSGFTKSGSITFSIASDWTAQYRDEDNNAFTDTTPYYYIRIRRTADALTTTPKIVKISIGLAIDDYYTSPKQYGKYISAVKKGSRLFFNYKPVAKYNVKFYDRRDFEQTWNNRDNIPMYNVNDNFLGVNFLLNSNKLNSRQDGIEWSTDAPIVNNCYQYKLTSNKAVNIPWTLYNMELAEKSVGIGSSSNKLR